MQHLPSTDDREDLASLAERARIDPQDVPNMLAGSLDDAARDLRRAWLAKAHRPADATLKSPCNGEISQLPDGQSICFGYERELSAGLLERRAPLCHPVPRGWQSVRILYRSGQAALASLLHHVAQAETGLPLRCTMPAGTSRRERFSTCGRGRCSRRARGAPRLSTC